MKVLLLPKSFGASCDKALEVSGACAVHDDILRLASSRMLKRPKERSNLK